jgi:hypothetical protein
VLANFRVAVVDTVNSRPLRPRVVVGSLIRRLRQQLKVGNRLGTVTNRGTNAVVTSITTTNDNNMFALGGNVGVIGELGVKERLGVLVKELHGKVNALQVASLDREVTSDGSTGGNDNSVIASPKNR